MMGASFINRSFSFGAWLLLLAGVTLGLQCFGSSGVSAFTVPQLQIGRPGVCTGRRSNSSFRKIASGTSMLLPLRNPSIPLASISKLTKTQQHQLLGPANDRVTWSSRKRHQARWNRIRSALLRCIRFQAVVALKVRRWTVTAMAATIVWLAAAGYHSPVAVATTTATATKSTVTPTQRLFSWSTSIDEMVDHYVKDHMFDDDVYDPVESAYRETYDDIVSGTYPTKLKDVTTSVLGKSAAVSDLISGDTRSGSSDDNNKVIAVFVQASQLLTKNFGLSETVAQVILAVTAFAGSFFSFVAVFAGLSFVLKQNLRRELRKRYGDDYRYVAQPELFMNTN